MEYEDINELNEMIQKFLKKKGYNSAQITGFLSAQFLITMAMNGYTEDFFRNTIDKLKYSYPFYLSKFTKVIDEKRK